MSKRDKIAEKDSGYIVLEGLEFDEAIIGISYAFERSGVAYDYFKVIEILTRSGMSHEEAEEYFEFNILGDKRVKRYQD